MIMIKTIGDTPDAVITGEIFGGKTIKEAVEYCKNQDKLDDHTTDAIMTAMYQMTEKREHKIKGYTMQGKIQDVLNTYASLLRGLLTPLQWIYGVNTYDIIVRSSDERGIVVLKFIYIWIHNYCWVRPDLITDRQHDIAKIIADLVRI